MKEVRDAMTKVLVTGGAGFIGSNFIRHVLSERSDWTITNLDKLTYAGNLENLKDVQDNPRYHFVKGDIADRKFISELLKQHFQVLVNFAAESHVDRSITDASPFIETNIKGTQVLLEAARQYRVDLFVQVSTDEVYGSLEPEEKFTEETPLSPNSPYSASKAAADLLCHAYHRTYGLPMIITRCSNNYGPYQFPEKLIPLVITNALEGREIPVYGDGLNVRDWIYVVDHCRAIERVISQGRSGEVYNIGGNCERTNIELVRRILQILNKPESLIKFVADRPGHDRRYAMDITKIERELGWRPAISFEEGLEATVRWYMDNESWCQRARSGEYVEYYKRQYANR